MLLQMASPLSTVSPTLHRVHHPPTRRGEAPVTPPRVRAMTIAAMLIASTGLASWFWPGLLPHQKIQLMRCGDVSSRIMVKALHRGLDLPRCTEAWWADRAIPPQEVTTLIEDLAAHQPTSTNLDLALGLQALHMGPTVPLGAWWLASDRTHPLHAQVTHQWSMMDLSLVDPIAKSAIQHAAHASSGVTSTHESMQAAPPPADEPEQDVDLQIQHDGPRGRGLSARPDEQRGESTIPPARGPRSSVHPQGADTWLMLLSVPEDEAHPWLRDLDGVATWVAEHAEPEAALMTLLATPGPSTLDPTSDPFAVLYTRHGRASATALLGTWIADLAHIELVVSDTGEGRRQLTTTAHTLHLSACGNRAPATEDGQRLSPSDLLVDALDNHRPTATQEPVVTSWLAHHQGSSPQQDVTLPSMHLSHILSPPRGSTLSVSTQPCP